MSEVGSGDIRDLRQRVAWAARAADRNPKPYASGRWLRDVSALGHAEIDWQGGTWAVAPPVASALPATGGWAVLAGSRRVGLLEHLEDLVATHVERTEITSSDGPLPVPSTVFVQADSHRELRESLAEAGVRYVGCAARRIAVGLRQITLGAVAAPPGRGDAVEHLSGSVDDISFCDGMPTNDGLCRTSIYGRPSYRYRLNGTWYHTDHSTGILIDRADRGISVMRFRPEYTADGEEIGTVFMDQGAPLPPLQKRSLVLCSGFPTQFSDVARTAIYRNVPKDIALLVAQSIRQQVSILA